MEKTDHVKGKITSVCQFKQLKVRKLGEPLGKDQKEEKDEDGYHDVKNVQLCKTVALSHLPRFAPPPFTVP
jgi:hypothetical protein